MPPFFSNDPVAAARAAEQGWVAVAAAVLSAAADGWVLALVALALYAWLERDVPSVLKVFVPGLAAIAAGDGAALLLRAFTGAPRVVAPGADGGLAGLAGIVARHGAPAGALLAVGAFAAYSLLVYRRRALLAPALALAAAAARVWGGAPVPVAAAGLGAGVALGAGVWLAATRLFPDGALSGRRVDGATARAP